MNWRPPQPEEQHVATMLRIQKASQRWVTKQRVDRIAESKEKEVKAEQGEPEPKDADYGYDDLPEHLRTKPSRRREATKKEIKDLHLAWKQLLIKVKDSKPRISPETSKQGSPGRGGTAVGAVNARDDEKLQEEEDPYVRAHAALGATESQFRLPCSELLEYRRRSREIRRVVAKGLPGLKQVPLAQYRPLLFPEEEPIPEPVPRSDADLYCSEKLDQLHGDICGLPRLGLRYQQLRVDEDYKGITMEGFNSLQERGVERIGGEKTEKARTKVELHNFQAALRHKYNKNVKLLRVFAEMQVEKLTYAHFCVLIKELDLKSRDESLDSANLFYTIDKDQDGIIDKNAIISIYDGANTESVMKSMAAVGSRTTNTAAAAAEIVGSGATNVPVPVGKTSQNKKSVLVAGNPSPGE